MATIQDYLNQIKNAIYGKDVRQAIHDGIQQCYYDGKAGSTDLEARQRLDSAEGSINSLDTRMSTAEGDIVDLDARVDQIVAPSGEAPSAAEVADGRIVDGITYNLIGDAIRAVNTNLKSELPHNAFDIFGMMHGESGTHKGITFTYDRNSYTVSGTATADAFRNLFYSTTSLPFGIIAGETYKVKYSTSNTKVRLVMYFYNSGGSLIDASQYITADKEVTIPSNAVGMIIRINVVSGTAISTPLTVTFHMLNALTNKELEDVIQANTDAILQYNVKNVLFYGEQVTKTHNSTTFTWNEAKDTCRVVCSATSHSASMCNMFYSVASLPSIFEAGKTYYLKYKSTQPTGQACLCDIWIFRNGNVDTANPDIVLNVASDRKFILPTDATGIVIRLRLIANYVVDETIKISLMDAKTNVDLADSMVKADAYYGYDEYVLTDETHNGITYTFDANANRCHLKGTSIGSSFHNIYYNVEKLPEGMKVGDTFLLYFYASNIHIACSVYFRLSDNTDYLAATTTISRVITVPENAVGMFFRYVVFSGYTLDDDAIIPLLVKREKQTILPFKAKRPLMVSVVDDDTSTDDLVTKFYQACKHNGIVGAYAVCTKQYIDGDSTISELLDYEADGFDMIPHCLEQQQYLHPTHEDYDRVLAYKNYAQCIRDFRTLGLINPQNMWIIPYGSSDDETISMGKSLGFEMAFTVSGGMNNYLTMNDRYRLHRCGLSPLAEVEDDTDPEGSGSMAKCKARVDELVASETGGWLIFMTHFNEWGTETWDATLDGNGYAVGYSRFNELIQYALNAGCEFVSMAEGATLMKPIIDRNFTMG